jgi:hypothetical protein
MKAVFGKRMKLKTSRIITVAMYALLSLFALALAVYVPEQVAVLGSGEQWLQTFMFVSRLAVAVLTFALCIINLFWRTKAEGVVLRGAVSIVCIVMFADLVIVANGGIPNQHLLNVLDMAIIGIVFLYRIFLIDRYLSDGSRS